MNRSRILNALSVVLALVLALITLSIFIGSAAVAVLGGGQ